MVSAETIGGIHLHSTPNGVLMDGWPSDEYCYGDFEEKKC